MLFVYGIGEERVVIIQIFYMAFFLFFISMFQVRPLSAYSLVHRWR